jgi:hypothetical protein
MYTTCTAFKNICRISPKHFGQYNLVGFADQCDSQIFMILTSQTSKLNYGFESLSPKPMYLCT